MKLDGIRVKTWGLGSDLKNKQVIHQTRDVICQEKGFIRQIWEVICQEKGVIRQTREVICQEKGLYVRHGR